MRGGGVTRGVAHVGGVKALGVGVRGAENRGEGGKVEH